MSIAVPAGFSVTSWGCGEQITHLLTCQGWYGELPQRSCSRRSTWRSLINTWANLDNKILNNKHEPRIGWDFSDLGKGKRVFSMWERWEPLEPERELWLTAKNLDHIYCQIPAVSVHWPKKNIAKRSNVRWRTWKRSTLALHKVLSGGPRQLYAFICAGIQVVSFSWKVSSIQIESEVDIYLMPFSMAIIHLFSKNAKIILGWGERESALPYLCSSIIGQVF